MNTFLAQFRGTYDSGYKMGLNKIVGENLPFPATEREYRGMVEALLMRGLQPSTFLVVIERKKRVS